MVSIPQIARDVERAVERGEVCAECGEGFSRAYGMPTLCNTDWNRTPVEERGPYLKADRNTEESVIKGKIASRIQRAKHGKR